MNINSSLKLVLFTYIIILSGCLPYKYGSKDDEEVTTIKLKTGKALNERLLKEQEDIAMNGGGRGLLDPMGSSATGIITDKITEWIKNEQDKYEDDYEFLIAPNQRRLNNDSSYFYSDVSSKGTFDPENIMFKGFTLVRKSGDDTAMMAVFELDTSNLWEIYGDGVFRLRLTDFSLDYAKAKIPLHGKHKIDIVFQIDFNASYVTKEGQFFNNVTLGSFNLTLTGIQVHNADSCKKYIGKILDGTCIIVPRSYGYSKLRDQYIYNQGAYSIHVKVKETSKPKLLNKYIERASVELINNVSSGGKDN